VRLDRPAEGRRRKPTARGIPYGRPKPYSTPKRLRVECRLPELDTVTQSHRDDTGDTSSESRHPWEADSRHFGYERQWMASTRAARSKCGPQRNG